MLVRIADALGIDKICYTDLTALFYDMHEGNRLLYEEMRKFPDHILGYEGDDCRSLHFLNGAIATGPR